MPEKYKFRNLLNFLLIVSFLLASCGVSPIAVATSVSTTENFPAMPTVILTKTPTTINQPTLVATSTEQERNFSITFNDKNLEVEFTKPTIFGEYLYKILTNTFNKIDSDLTAEQKQRLICALQIEVSRELDASIQIISSSDALGDGYRKSVRNVPSSRFAYKNLKGETLESILRIVELRLFSSKTPPGSFIGDIFYKYKNSQFDSSRISYSEIQKLFMQELKRVILEQKDPNEIVNTAKLLGIRLPKLTGSHGEFNTYEASVWARIQISKILGVDFTK